MVIAKIGAGALHLIFLCFLVLGLATTTTGLTLELIHRESERSPYYSPNLTDDGRYERLHKLSYARLQRFKSSSFEKANLPTIRPPVERISSTYGVSMKIGTGRGLNDYFLDLDTGSALTWIQCLDCDPCFKQRLPIYDPRASPTYYGIPCKDPLCRQPDDGYDCINGFCVYRVDYADDDYTAGVFSLETFGFQAIPPAKNFVYVANLSFGCSHSSHISHNDGVSAGILGMNAGPESFAVQLAGGLFSYCLAPKSSQRSSGYLRFRNDIPAGASVQRTPLEISKSTENYYLTLLDISVGNQRLKLDPGLFRRHGKEDGVVIDSGSFLTYIVRKAFLKAKAALNAYFMAHNLAPVGDKDDDDTCFTYRSGVESLFPSMTFHLQGAKLEVEGSHMFRFLGKRTRFCWNVGVDDKMTLIGAAQQLNKRFIYDLRQRMLFFSPENCAADT